MAAQPKVDESTVIRPDGAGHKIVDKNASTPPGLSWHGKTYKGKKRGGPAEIYPTWRPDTFYPAGMIVYYNGYDYKALVDQPGNAADGSNPASSGNWMVLQKGSTRNNGIFYHGGRVISSPTVLVYYIWYGNWAPYAKTQEVLRTFMNSLGGTPLWNVMTTYYDSTGGRVNNSLTLAGEATDNYSQGATLAPGGLEAVVSNTIGSGKLPLRQDALYFVLTSPDVRQNSDFGEYGTGSFGTMYCGLHNSFKLSGVDVRFAFVGNPITQARSLCHVNDPSPNGDSGGDAMANIVLHELADMVSAPDLTAWYDDSGPDPVPNGGLCSANGIEVGDKCIWQWGATKLDAKGARYNQTFGGRNYLLQQLWLNAEGGKCVLKY